MQNIKSIINNHNMKVLNNTAEIKESCNFRNKNSYPPRWKMLNQKYHLQSTALAKPAQL